MIYLSVEIQHDYTYKICLNWICKSGSITFLCREQCRVLSRCMTPFSPVEIHLTEVRYDFNGIPMLLHQLVYNLKIGSTGGLDNVFTVYHFSQSERY